MKSTNLRAVEPTLTELDAHLTLRSHLVGYQTTEDELLVWDALRNNHVVRSFMKQGSKANVARWFSYLTEAKDATVLVHRPKSDNVDGRSVGKDSGSNYDIGLQDTDHGVVTRFPPEPS